MHAPKTKSQYQNSPNPGGSVGFYSLTDDVLDIYASELFLQDASWCPRVVG